MKRVPKYLWAVLFTIFILSGIYILTAYASSNHQPRIITGFKSLAASHSMIKISAEEKSTLADVIALMPDSLDVYLDGSSNSETIPVSWYCISNDYEQSEYYYYQFSPKWDETQYSHTPDIDVLRDVPYIGVFITEDISESPALDYANGTDNCIYNGNEFYCNYDDEYKLYVIDSKTRAERIALNKHIGTMLTSKDVLYVLVFDEDQSSSLVRYNMNTFTSETLLDLSGSIHSMARRGSMIYLATNNGIVKLNLNNLALSQVIGEFGVSLVYFSDVNTLKYYTKDGEQKQILFSGRGDDFEDDPFAAFLDVNASAYYYDAVLWAVTQGITKGKTDTKFDPSGSCTRAQTVTFLWRYVGSPEPKSGNPFEDVSEKAYYYKAVIWAMEHGITNGKSKTAFSPNDTVSRAQAVTFLYRMRGAMPVDTGNSFSDVIHDSYYEDAVSWAVKESITKGKSNTIFGPDDYCSRAQIVTFLYRLNSTL